MIEDLSSLEAHVVANKPLSIILPKQTYDMVRAEIAGLKIIYQCLQIPGWIIQQDPDPTNYQVYDGKIVILDTEIYSFE